MPTAGSGRPRLPVAFDDAAWRRDVARVSPRGRALGDAARRRLESEGVALETLLRCEREHSGGTDLPGCVKLYVDQWGLVMRGAATPDGQLNLASRSGIDTRHAGAGSRVSMRSLTADCTAAEPRSGAPDRDQCRL